MKIGSPLLGCNTNRTTGAFLSWLFSSANLQATEKIPSSTLLKKHSLRYVIDSSLIPFQI